MGERARRWRDERLDLDDAGVGVLPGRARAGLQYRGRAGVRPGLAKGRGGWRLHLPVRGYRGGIWVYAGLGRGPDGVRDVIGVRAGVLRGHGDGVNGGLEQAVFVAAAAGVGGGRAGRQPCVEARRAEVGGGRGGDGPRGHGCGGRRAGERAEAEEGAEEGEWAGEERRKEEEDVEKNQSEEASIVARRTRARRWPG